MIKKNHIALLALITLLTPSLPSAYAQDEGPAEDVPNVERDNTFPLGIIGGRAECLYETNFLVVKTLFAGELGETSGLHIGDKITAVNGVAFEVFNDDFNSGGRGPLMALGVALDIAEGAGEGLTLTIDRNGSNKNITLNVPRRGSFGNGTTYPDGNLKANTMSTACADHLASTLPNGNTTGSGGVTRAIVGLCLLSNGEDNHMQGAKVIADNYVANVDNIGNKSLGNWELAYSIIFLSEYVHVTGEQSYIPHIETLIERSYERQDPAGIYGHSELPASYDGNGLNIVSSAMIWGWASAERIGATIDQERFQRSLDHIKDAGHSDLGGGIDHIAYSVWGNGNHGLEGAGRTGNTAMALFLKNHEFDFAERMSEYLGVFTPRIRESHAMTCLGMVSAFLATRNIDSSDWQKQMDEWVWYFTLAMDPDGTAAYIPGKANNGGDEYLGPDEITSAMAGLILSSGNGRLMCTGGQAYSPNAIMKRSYFHFRNQAIEINSGNPVSPRTLDTLTNAAADDSKPELQAEAQDILKRVGAWLEEQLIVARQHAANGQPIEAALASHPIRGRFPLNEVSAEAYAFLDKITADTILSDEYEAALILHLAVAQAVRDGYLASTSDHSERTDAVLDARSMRKPEQDYLRQLKILIMRYSGTAASRHATIALVKLERDTQQNWPY